MIDVTCKEPPRLHEATFVDSMDNVAYDITSRVCFNSCVHLGWLYMDGV